jgi:two-component system LytT family response regulator
VVDYLLKPIAFDRFFKSVQKAQTVIYSPPPLNPLQQAEPAKQDDFLSDFIFVKTEHKIQKVYLHDIFL